MRDAAPQGTYKVQALDRALPCWICSARATHRWDLAQVASSLQLHKSTAHRFLMVLERHRMVERTRDGEVPAGVAAVRFRQPGDRAIRSAGSRPTTSSPAGCRDRGDRAPVVLEASRVIYIDKIEPARSVRMITRIGASNPVHCTSVGKAMLAFLPEDRAAEVVRRIAL
jgi:DNA-binding IclR family transcriptional regulator